MIDGLSASSGSAFCTVKYTPRAFRLIWARLQSLK
jgi:hypothetical protein